MLLQQRFKTIPVPPEKRLLTPTTGLPDIIAFRQNEDGTVSIQHAVPLLNDRLVVQTPSSETRAQTKKRGVSMSRRSGQEGTFFIQGILALRQSLEGCWEWRTQNSADH